MRAATSAATCRSFLCSGRAARISKMPQKRSISAYFGHLYVKELGIKDCVLIEPTCGTGNFLDAILKKKLTKIRNIYLVSSNYARKISVFKEIF